MENYHLALAARGSTENAAMGRWIKESESPPSILLLLYRCKSRLRLCHNRLPLRIGIELLAYRVEELCHFIHDNGLEPPRMSDEKETTLRKILDTLAIPSPNDKKSNMAKEDEYQVPVQVPVSRSVPYIDPVEGLEGTELNQQAAINVPAVMKDHCLSNPALPSMSQQNCRSVTFEDENSVLAGESPDIIPNSWLCDLELGANIAASAFDLKEQHINIPTMTDMGLVDAVESECSSNLTDDQGATSDIETLVDEISDRLGTIKISNSGKTRFYGPTSTFNLREIPFLDSYESDYMSPSYSSETEEDVPAALEQHLMDLYFSWQDPLFHVVNRAIYEDAREKWKNLEDNPFYSDALRNAMWVFLLICSDTTC